MSITIEMPNEIQCQLEQTWDGQLSQKVLEAVAIESYRQGALSRGQVSELLALSFTDTELFLIEHAVHSSYTLDDISTQTAAIEKV